MYRHTVPEAPMKASLRTVHDHGVVYQCLMFCCPGCALMHHNSGLHMLPVNTTLKSPSWSFDGNIEEPTVNPSILTHSGVAGKETTCHSYLRAGMFDFLGDCTHELAGQKVPMLDLPAWAIDEDT